MKQSTGPSARCTPSMQPRASLDHVRPWMSAGGGSVRLRAGGSQVVRDGGRCYENFFAGTTWLEAGFAELHCSAMELNTMVP